MLKLLYILNAVEESPAPYVSVC